MNRRDFLKLFPTVLGSTMLACSIKLRSKFKSTEDVNRSVEASTAILKEMRQTIDEMINHIGLYLGTT